MLHPYNHRLMHNNQHRERVNEAEHARLVRLVSESRKRLWFTEDLKKVASTWWIQRIHAIKQSHLAENKVVMPEA